MAEVSYLNLHGDDDEKDDFLVPFSPRTQDLDASPPDLDFPFLCRQIRRDPSTQNHPFQRENQVNNLIDMLHHQSHSSSRLAGETDFVDCFVVSNENEDLEMDFGVEGRNCYDDDDDDVLFESRTWGSELEDQTYLMGGLSVADTDEEGENELVGVDDDFGINGGCDDEASLGLCWDAFQLEDDDDHIGWDVPPHQHLEWEEVDDAREVLSMFLDPEPEPETDHFTSVEELEWQVFLNFRNLEANSANAEAHNYASVDDLEWQVFLNIHTFEADPDQLGDYNDAEDEMLFGQFADNGDSALVQPPASKKVVEGLLSFVMTLEDFQSNNALCAVCNDEIAVGEKVKQLPCSHRYHGDCIHPWLCIRNTCPVCRHELPTDDPDYERRKAERVARDL